MLMGNRALWLILSVIAGSSCSHPDQLTVVSYGGGVYQQSHRQAFIVPFEKSHNIKIKAISWFATMTELRKRVHERSSGWQVVEITDAQFREGVHEDLFEKLTVKMPKDDFLAGTQQTYGVANVYWGTVLVFGLNDFAKGEGPADWRDFWDIIKFPGKRGLQDDPRGTLEFALLADGVPVESLYPLDVDRAFRKLEKLRPYVDLWWKEGEEPINALVSRKIQMSSAWNGRVFAAHRSGTRIGYSWNQSALDLDWWVVPEAQEMLSWRLHLLRLPQQRVGRQISRNELDMGLLISMLLNYFHLKFRPSCRPIRSIGRDRLL